MKLTFLLLFKNQCYMFLFYMLYSLNISNCILTRQRDKSKQTDGSPVALFNMFISRVRDQLHIVLAMSPIGDAFRNRLRKFPSLVNCCTIDWFQVINFMNVIFGHI